MKKLCNLIKQSIRCKIYMLFDLQCPSRSISMEMGFIDTVHSGHYFLPKKCQ